MIKEFREFIARGSVLDLAIGVIIGAAFGKIITSLVDDIIMPPIGLLLGRVDFTNLFVDLSGQGYPSLEVAKAAGAPTINYGVFLNTLIQFAIIAFVLFLIIRQANRLKRAEEPPAPTTRDCPYCLEPIPIKATRCAHCTSDLTTPVGTR